MFERSGGVSRIGPELGLDCGSCKALLLKLFELFCCARAGASATVQAAKNAHASRAEKRGVLGVMVG